MQIKVVKDFCRTIISFYTKNAKTYAAFFTGDLSNAENNTYKHNVTNNE